MRTSGNTSICYKSRRSSRIRKELSSKINSLSRNKNSWNIFCNKSCKLKPRMRRKNIPNSKPVETLQRISHSHSAKGQFSLPFLGNNNSYICHKGNRKVAACDRAIKLDKRKSRKRKKKNIERDEASRLQRRARYLLIKMKLEQNLLDAYSGDGWNGQSREKIKPENELKRAKKQILECKLGIRDAIRQLDLLSSIGSIEDSVMYPDGSVFHEHIFCAKCRSRETFPDNDIILCDGTCNCGFHQKCLEPSLEKIPPGDQGWLCKFCECKMEILEAINAHLGTCFAANSSWEDIFKEAATGPDAGYTYLNHAEEWPSEDSEDEDYNPEINENSNSRTGVDENMAGDSSSSSSLFCSSDEAMSYSESRHNNGNGGSYHVRHKDRNKADFVDSIINSESGETNDCEIMSYRRQRRDVDYKKLHDEMFGKDLAENEQQSEDEDWGPHRMKRRRTESITGTITDNCVNEAGCSDISTKKISLDKKPLFRIPSNAVQKLRQVFAENELPSRAVKENLSKQLGISSEKVSKWFKNARYAALKMRKAGIAKPHNVNNVTKRSRINAGKAGSFDEVASIDNSVLLPLSSIIHVRRNLRKLFQRKKQKSLNIPSRTQHKRAANTESANEFQNLRTSLTENQCPSMSINGNLLKELMLPHGQVRTSVTNAMNLTKQVRGPRSKFTLERAFRNGRGTVFQLHEMTENQQLYAAEIERLCSLEERLRNLKKALLSCQDNEYESDKSHLNEPSVIYVPVAEVREREGYLKIIS
ncbi:pathogenesis-related homeodomain protein-like [Phoenix dactylifera]|uniref:Pathogenesis-related homeodomain protein-like n=1 Tax=Phoenix dactylifera TaxID=42345 RepID=A0A8B9ADD1_PHODC|nr:pathogenesis-related homeodomain protein-like [Phoenix dactylifera]